MLPELILDNENFEDIMDEARNMIVSLYPEWTDFNYHDPGITLIEMFSWLKESQQFYLDQISDETRKKFLKLLGMRQKHKSPALALANVEVSEDITVSSPAACTVIPPAGSIVSTMQTQSSRASALPPYFFSIDLILLFTGLLLSTIKRH